MANPSERTPAAATNASATDVEQHSLGRSVALHLYPGLLILAVYVIAALRFSEWGIRR